MASSEKSTLETQVEPSPQSSDAAARSGMFGRFFERLGIMWETLFGSKPNVSGPDFFGLRILLGWMGGFLLLGLVFLVFGYAQTWILAATIVVWTFGLCASGTILGFLFAIPRVVSEATPSAPTARVNPTQSDLASTLITEVRRHRLAANTNLEQVSDWLTKIIVGVGLIELTEIPGLINRLAAIMSPSFGQPPLSLSVATSAIVLFSAVGFLIGYVTTRAFLPHILEASEQQAIELILSRLEATKKPEKI